MVFVFFIFVAFVFFAFVVVVVVVCPVSWANTGIASENATTKVNSITKSFFMLGLDLPMNFFHFYFEQGVGHFGAITPNGANQLEHQRLCEHGTSRREMTRKPSPLSCTNSYPLRTNWSRKGKYRMSESGRIPIRDSDTSPNAGSGFPLSRE